MYKATTLKVNGLAVWTSSRDCERIYGSCLFVQLMDLVPKYVECQELFLEDTCVRSSEEEAKTCTNVTFPIGTELKGYYDSQSLDDDDRYFCRLDNPIPSIKVQVVLIAVFAGLSLLTCCYVRCVLKRRYVPPLDLSASTMPL